VAQVPALAVVVFSDLLAASLVTTAWVSLAGMVAASTSPTQYCGISSLAESVWPMSSKSAVASFPAQDEEDGGGGGGESWKNHRRSGN